MYKDFLMDIKSRGFQSCCMLFAALIGCTAVPVSQTHAADISGQYCVGPEAGKTAFKIFSALPAADGGLDFGVSVWDESGRNCGVAGHALASASGWRFEQNIDSSTEAERCALDITVTDGVITVTADPNASCKSACGINVAISTEVFPAASKQDKVLTNSDLAPENFYNTQCPSP